MFSNLVKFIVIDYDPEVINAGSLNKLSMAMRQILNYSKTGIERSKLIVSTMTDHQTNVF